MGSKSMGSKMKRSLPVLFSVLMVSQTSVAGRFGAFYAEHETEHRKALREKAGYAEVNSDPEFWTVAEIRFHIAEVARLTDEVRALNAEYPQVLNLSERQVGRRAALNQSQSKSMSQRTESLLFAMEDEDEEVNSAAGVSDEEEGISTQVGTSEGSGTADAELDVKVMRAEEDFLRRFRELRRRSKRILKLFRVLDKAELTPFYQQAYDQGKGEALVANLQFLECAVQKVKDLTSRSARFSDWAKSIQVIIHDLEAAQQEKVELGAREAAFLGRQETLGGYSPMDSLSVSPLAGSPHFSLSSSVTEEFSVPRTASVSPASQNRKSPSPVGFVRSSRSPTPTYGQAVSPVTSSPQSFGSAPISFSSGARYSPTNAKPLPIPMKAETVMTEGQSVMPSDPRAVFKKSLNKKIGKGRFDLNE